MKKKILTVCQRGNSRSVATAYILKDERQYSDVLACGIETVSPNTFTMLADWADKIIVVGEKYVWDKVPKNEHTDNKVTWVDVGPDQWGNPFHPELQALARKFLDDLHL